MGWFSGSSKTCLVIWMGFWQFFDGVIFWVVKNLDWSKICRLAIHNFWQVFLTQDLGVCTFTTPVMDPFRLQSNFLWSAYTTLPAELGTPIAPLCLVVPKGHWTCRSGHPTTSTFSTFSPNMFWVWFVHTLILKVIHLAWPSVGIANPATCSSIITTLYLQDEACFYQCEPTLAHFADPAFLAEGLVKHVPICASYCTKWFDACKDDKTCVEKFQGTLSVSTKILH